MKNKLIGVLMGGVSSEREISLRSGKNVSEALASLGYQVKNIDIQSRDCTSQLKTSGIEVAYNILHGEFGEDGGIQKILEDLKIPYTGSGVVASQNCIDKILTKEILIKNNLPTPAYELSDGKTVKMKAPLVLKPATEGSSIGVTIVKEDDNIIPELQKTKSKFNCKILIEEFIKGAEVTVGVLKDRSGLVALPILELIPKNEFYDFESKYTPGGTTFVLPANLEQAVTDRIKEIAKQAFAALQCEGAARVDFIVKNRQEPYILEINTNPGMTAQSDLPAEAKEAGISFPELCELILLQASLGKN